MTNNILSLRNVQFRWQGSAGFRLTLPQFDLGTGEKVLLLGQSGSGKSTLLSLLCGTIAPTSGQITIAGTETTKLTASQKDRFRAETIGVIFQQFNLLPFGTVADNILLPLSFAPERRKRAGQPAVTKARQLCAALGLPEATLQRHTKHLSVGQQQRVAAARALIGNPPLIIADEPTSALDADTQTTFLDLLFAQVDAQGSSLLMVSHDARIAERFDRTLAIEDLLSSGPLAA